MSLGVVGASGAPLEWKEIALEGGATVKDKTSGIARARFSEEETKKNGYPCYQIEVKERKAVFPGGQNVMFIGSRFITFQCCKGNYIEITEDDGESATTLYASSEDDSVVQLTDNKTGESCEYVECYPYIPKELTLEEALHKVKNLPSVDVFKPLKAAYNNHGVVVVGLDAFEKWALYRANPNEAEVKKLRCKKIGDNTGTYTSIISKDGSVVFSYLDAANGILKGLLDYKDPLDYTGIYLKFPIWTP